MAGRSRGAKELWRKRLERFEKCGLSVKEFCIQESVSEPSFYQWRKKLGGVGGRRRQAAPAFQPVQVTSAVDILSVVFPNGVRLEAPAGSTELAGVVVRELTRAVHDNQSGAS